MDEIDRKIVIATQAGLPLVAKPYEAVAKQVGIEEAEVRQRMGKMLESGAIRRIGLVPNHYKLGYVANGMTVWDVADEDIKKAGEEIGSLDFVSHCYHRPRHLPDWSYCLFAMVHGKSREEVVEKTARIANLLGERCRGHMILYSSRILKKTGLRLGGGE
jgi:DNA-binding Lrp family transcriptional regulator